MWLGQASQALLNDPKRSGAEIIDRFIHSLQQAGKSVATLSAYRDDLENFWAFVGTWDLDPVDIKIWLRQRGGAARSKARYAKSVRHFYEWACREGLLQHNPAQGVLAPTPDGLLSEPLSAYHIHRIATYQPTTRRQVLIHFVTVLALGCGMRLSEIMSLEASDVRLDGGYISVPGLGKRRRLAPMPDFVWQAAERFMASRRTSKPRLIRQVGAGSLRSGVASHVRRRTGRKVGFRVLRATHEEVMLSRLVPEEAAWRTGKGMRHARGAAWVRDRTE